MDEYLEFYCEILRVALPPRHAVDNGARTTVATINTLRELVADAARDYVTMGPGSWVEALEDFEAPPVIEADDEKTPELQVADLAAGHARALYGAGGSEGLRKVRDFFRGVVFNGDLLQRHH